LRSSMRVLNQTKRRSKRSSLAASPGRRGVGGWGIGRLKGGAGPASGAGGFGSGRAIQAGQRPPRGAPPTGGGRHAAPVQGPKDDWSPTPLTAPFPEGQHTRPQAQHAARFTPPRSCTPPPPPTAHAEYGLVHRHLAVAQPVHQGVAHLRGGGAPPPPLGGGAPLGGGGGGGGGGTPAVSWWSGG
jgi:hypothetical protein